MTMTNYYNKAERFFAKSLSKTPALKKLIKALYGRLTHIFFKKKYKIKTQNKIIEVSINNHESFFGYYDKNPMNNVGDVLCHITKHSTSLKPDKNKPVEVALFKNRSQVPNFRIKTSAYNWQQGARLHWLNDDLFVFNDFSTNNKKYIARVFSRNSLQEVKCFGLPVQDSYKTDYFLSINYQRLAKLRPDYGYFNLPKLTKDQIDDLKNDGIWFVDYQTGRGNIVYKLSDVVGLSKERIFDDAQHWVNHIMISPGGESFIFIHRYLYKRQRFDRLLLGSRDGSALRILSNYGMVSHCAWVNENMIFAYMRGPDQTDGYHFINVSKGEIEPFKNRYFKLLGDGHPSFFGDYFVTDTYPDKSRMQHLLLCNWKTGNLTSLGEFFHGLNYSGETRCDLHPRLSNNSKTVFFDSIFSGSRKLYYVNV